MLTGDYKTTSCMENIALASFEPLVTISKATKHRLASFVCILVEQADLSIENLLPPTSFIALNSKCASSSSSAPNMRPYLA